MFKIEGYYNDPQKQIPGQRDVEKRPKFCRHFGKTGVMKGITLYQVWIFGRQISLFVRWW